MWSSLQHPSIDAHRVLPDEPTHPVSLSHGHQYVAFAGSTCGPRSPDYFQQYDLTNIVQGVQLRSGPYFNMRNLFTKIYNMLYYTTNLYLQ